MLRSHWKGALLVALAWASAARGQQPGAPAPASPYAPRTASGPAAIRSNSRPVAASQKRTLPSAVPVISLSPLGLHSSGSASYRAGPGFGGTVQERTSRRVTASQIRRRLSFRCRAANRRPSGAQARRSGVGPSGPRT